MAGQNSKKRPLNHVKGAVNNRNATLYKILVAFTIFEVIYIVFFSCLMVLYISQLKRIGHLGDFLEKTGDLWLAICVQLITVFLAILGVGAWLEGKWKRKIIQTRELVWIAIVLPVLIGCLMTISLVLDAKSIIIKVQEENSTSQDVLFTENLAKSIVDKEQFLVMAELYHFEEDPYVSSEKIDGYRGVQKGTTKQEGNEIVEAAKIIYADIFDEFHLRTDVDEFFGDYESRTQIANAFHEEYKKMYKNPPDSSITEVTQFMRQERINVLNQAIDYRMQADNSYKDAENRRMEAEYYIETGEEYQAAGDMEKAEECYEQGAIWGMKALYLAVPGTDTKKMEDCLKKIELASERMSAINGRGSDKLSRTLEIYTEVVSMRIAELQT